jgi:uncharacterized caspase-like protein
MTPGETTFWFGTAEYRAAPPRNGRRALVIGNDAYQAIERLGNAKGDAGALSGALDFAGFEVATHYDLDSQGLFHALSSFTNDLRQDDIVLFFFAGHGLQIDGVNYLLPVDIAAESEDHVRSGALSLQKVLDEVRRARPVTSLFVLDACRDNPFPGGNIGARKGLAPTTAANDQMILFSAGAGQRAIDSLGASDSNPNSVFTRSLVKHIKRRGADAQYVIKQVRDEVAALARSVGHDQVPALYDQSTGQFKFRK